MQLLSDLTLTKANLTPHHHPQQAIKLGHTLAVKLAPPIILVTPTIARLRVLLDVLVAVHAVPPLLVVRKSDSILHVLLAPVESRSGSALDDEPFVVLRSGDLDVGGVGAVPVSDRVAGVVDDVDVPFGGWVNDFETVGCWGAVLGLSVLGELEVWDLLLRAMWTSHLPVCQSARLSSSVGRGELVGAARALPAKSAERITALANMMRVEVDF